MGPNKVRHEDASLAGGFVDRLNDLTVDSSSPAFLVPSPMEIRHDEGWHIAVAFYEDDQWWLDFTHYGSDANFPGVPDAT